MRGRKRRRGRRERRKLRGRKGRRKTLLKYLICDLNKTEGVFLIYGMETGGHDEELIWG